MGPGCGQTPHKEWIWGAGTFCMNQILPEVNRHIEVHKNHKNQKTDQIIVELIVVRWPLRAPSPKLPIYGAPM